MSIQFQIALPLLLTFAALVVIMIVRRYVRLETLVLSAVVLGLTCVTMIWGFSGGGVLFGHRFGVESEEGSLAKRYDQTGNSLIIAAQYLLEGQYDEAGAIVNALRAEDAANPEILLADARTALFAQEYENAVLLYQKLAATGKSDVASEELKNALLLGQSSTGDAALVRYLTGRGYDAQAYGLQGGSLADTVDEQDVLQAVGARMEEACDAYASASPDAEDIVRAAGYAAELTAVFSAYTAGEEIDTEAAEKTLRKLTKAMEEGKSLAQNQFLRIARLKGLVLTGSYEDIAGYIDAGAGTEELMIIAQLYLNGAVSESDFQDSYVAVEDAVYTNVLEACNRILDAHVEDLTKVVRKAYQQKIETIRTQKRYPALTNLKQDLLDRVADTGSTLTSKVYLTLAKVENRLGNTEQAEQYIGDALGTVSTSDDMGYTEPMNAVIGIIEGTSENGTEDLKNVAGYVEQALDNSLPLAVDASQLPAPDENDGSATEDFQQQMTSVVSEKTATINIGAINKDNFPEVSARVQIQSGRLTESEDIRSVLEVYDCNSAITEYTLEKLTFEKSRIILLCDVSGSMSGNVSSLKNAIVKFAENMSANEEICVVGFDSEIKFVTEFSNDPETVASFAEQISAQGGTDMFSSLLYAGDLLPDDINCNNIIIELTDGQDNNPVGEATMRNEITAMAADKDVTVYTLGLGSGVDTEYLSLIADAGNGSFLYVDSEVSLETFYDFIHQQLTNQYILRYTAKNRTLNERKLELSLTGELGGASKIYYLVPPEYSDTNGEAYDAFVVTDAELTVSGFTSKFLYKSSADQTINLKGTGFDPGEEITVKLTDNVKYTLQATFVDANTYAVTIPSNIATGTYDLEVSVRGESFELKDELTIAVQGTEKSFRYGSYVFTALRSDVDGSGQTVLSGNVTMNGWLRFRGDLVIETAYQDSGKVRIRDESGAYISYAENNSAGLANYLAKQGIPVSIGALGSFYIYADSYEAEKYDAFPVEPVELLDTCNLLFLQVENFKLSLYPDMVRFEGLNLQYDLPFQKQLLRNFPDMRSFSYDVDTEMLLNATRVGFVADINYSDMKKTDFSMVAIPMKLSGLTVGIDTLVNDYDLEAKVKFKAIGDMDSLTLKFAVKDGKFDTIGLQEGGYSITLLKAPIPVSMGDFGFELSGFSQYESSASTLSNILSTKITFKFEVNVADISSYLPGLAKVISDDEVAAVTFSNAEISATLKTFTFEFASDVKLFTVLDIGHCEVSMGSFKYTNALIGYNNETEYGLRAKVTVGSTWDTTNLSLQLEGSAEVTVGYPYTGLWLNGVCDFDIGWWILRADFDVSGDVLVGVYKNSSDNLQFSVIVRGTNNSGAYSGFHLYVTRATGLDIYTY